MDLRSESQMEDLLVLYDFFEAEEATEEEIDKSFPIH